MSSLFFWQRFIAEGEEVVPRKVVDDGVDHWGDNNKYMQQH